MNDDCHTTMKNTLHEPRKRFWLRPRKRPKSDAVSISSMDISIESDVGKKKKRRRITEVASSIFASTSAVSKLGNTLHKSFSMQSNSPNMSIAEDEPDTNTIKRKYDERKISTEENGNFLLRSWVLDVVDPEIRDRLKSTLSRSEIKRQEAIYELYCGENVLLNDLCILKDTYFEPLSSSNIFTPDEFLTLFGDILQFIDSHTKLRDELLRLRDNSGFTESVGPTILHWLSTVKELYLERCRTQVWARHLLDERKANSKRFQGFLKRRLESAHSVDLWTYLDVPRSRIVKYPLLVKEILRHTPTNHVDETFLKDASIVLSSMLHDIDKAMGDAECKLAQTKIIVKLEYDPAKCIENASELLTEGELKDSRGTKFHCFLFDTCFALTRPVRRFSKKYNLCLPVVPKQTICANTNERQQTELEFKIGEHVLATESSHEKKHWVDCINRVGKNINPTDNSSFVDTDKENQSKSVTPKIHHSKRKSTGSLGDRTLPFSLRKNISKQKRNSLQYF